MMLSACACACKVAEPPHSPTTAPQPPLAPEQAVLEGRQALLAALEAQHAFAASRLVAHVSHVCSLAIGGSDYPVVDLQELVRGVAVPRGANAILILDPHLRLLHRIEYATERPLFCDGNRLYVWGDITVSGLAGEGNEITLGAQGELWALKQVEANDVPAPEVENGTVR